MSYQYKREPLTPDEANRLANVCKTHEEKLVIWSLLDTGLRVSELASLSRDKLDWQGHRIMIYGKGGAVWLPLEAAGDPVVSESAASYRRAPGSQ